jgi:hypothetical protein
VAGALDAVEEAQPPSDADGGSIADERTKALVGSVDSPTS